jgi:hypothetical protein
MLCAAENQITVQSLYVSPVFVLARRFFTAPVLLGHTLPHGHMGCLNLAVVLNGSYSRQAHLVKVVYNSFHYP